MEKMEEKKEEITRYKRYKEKYDEYQAKWRNSEAGKEYFREYRKTDKYKDAVKRTRRKRHLNGKHQLDNDKYYSKGSHPTSYRSWTTYECEMILKKELSDDELSKLLTRSIRAIHDKRHKLIREREKENARSNVSSN